MVAEKEFFNSILTDKTKAVDLFTLENIVKKYPYLEIARLIYLRELKKRDNDLFIENLKLSSVFFSDRRFAYFFINSKKKQISAELYDINIISTDYFALENSGASKEPLKNLAKRLKDARLAQTEKLENCEKSFFQTEENVKKLIAEKRYFEALKILRKINLNNSEKSIYFAPQIKYLETILNFNG